MTGDNKPAVPNAGKSRNQQRLTESDVDRIASERLAALLKERGIVEIDIERLVSERLATLLKDKEVVEIEVAAKIAARLAGWAKLFAVFAGVPLALFVVIVGIFGVTKLGDIKEAADTVEETTKQQIADVSEAVTKAAAAADKAEQDINQQVTDAQNKVTAAVASANASANEATQLISDADAKVGAIVQKANASVDKVNAVVDQAQKDVEEAVQRANKLVADATAEINETSKSVADLKSSLSKTQADFNQQVASLSKKVETIAGASLTPEQFAAVDAMVAPYRDYLERQVGLDPVDEKIEYRIVKESGANVVMWQGGPITILADDIDDEFAVLVPYTAWRLQKQSGTITKFYASTVTAGLLRTALATYLVSSYKNSPAKDDSPWEDETPTDLSFDLSSEMEEKDWYERQDILVIEKRSRVLPHVFWAMRGALGAQLADKLIVDVVLELSKNARAYEVVGFYPVLFDRVLGHPWAMQHRTEIWSIINQYKIPLPQSK